MPQVRPCFGLACWAIGTEVVRRPGQDGRLPVRVRTVRRVSRTFWPGWPPGAVALLVACCACARASSPEVNSGELGSLRPAAVPVATGDAASEPRSVVVVAQPRPAPVHRSVRFASTDSEEPSSVGPPASALRYPFQEPLPDPADRRGALSAHFSRLSPAQCRVEAQRAKLSVVRDRRPTPGVGTAFRVNGPMQGVKLVTPGRKSPFGVFDCRLGLALQRLAKVAARHDVVAVRVDNMYRPHAHLPGKRKPSQHSYGLAADITAFELKDGRTLLVESDWHGEIGEPPCGPEARLEDPSDESVRLRNLVCDVAHERLFDTILTPNYDRAHRDHVHMDLRRGARSAIVR